MSRQLVPHMGSGLQLFVRLVFSLYLNPFVELVLRAILDFVSFLAWAFPDTWSSISLRVISAREGARREEIHSYSKCTDCRPMESAILCEGEDPGGAVAIARGLKPGLQSPRLHHDDLLCGREFPEQLSGRCLQSLARIANPHSPVKYRKAFRARIEPG